MKEFTRSMLTLVHRFIWSSPTVTRSGPHIRDANNVQRMWNYFVIASFPAWLIGLWSLGHQTNLAIADFNLEEVPGWRAWLLNHAGVGFDAFSVTACFLHGLLYFLPVFLTALVAGAFWEIVFAARRSKPVDEGLLSIAWLFALILPPAIPLYQVAIGMSFAIMAGDTAGYAISYGLGQGATMVAALWGVFIWKEFKEAPHGTGRLLAMMFVFFIVGLGLIIYSHL